METNSATTRSKRRKGTERTSRRFSTKAVRQKLSLSVPSSKKERIRGAIQVLAFISFIIFLLSTFSSWRSHLLKKRATSISLSFFKDRSQGPRITVEHSKATKIPHSTFSAPSSSSSTHQSQDSVPHIEKYDDNIKPGERYHESEKEDPDTSSKEQPANDQDETQTSVENEDLKILEWYSRNDFKSGVRPICRISKPFILSNGTIFVPQWMRAYEKVLQRCGLGNFHYYPTDDKPDGVEKVNHVETDFVLTIHPEKFQEPTYVPSVYLTEHILKSVFLFDIYSGEAHISENTNERFCILSEHGENCDAKRPTATVLKPGIFVPRRIERLHPNSWPRKYVDMIGEAYGQGEGVIHINASNILVRRHIRKSTGLIGTSFRSVLTADGMFRHLPTGSLRNSNYYSEKNGIMRTARTVRNGDKCTLSIGIAKQETERVGIRKISELSNKIETLSQLAMPSDTINVKPVHFGQKIGLEDHITAVQDIDIYIASGEHLNSLGYLRSGASVFELMPFGVVPNTHESLAKALGLKYFNIKAKPQDARFKECIKKEYEHLRQKRLINNSEKPLWYEPTMKAWAKAVGDFVLSGSSNLDFLTGSTAIHNHYARVCAMRQVVEVSIDDAARKIVQAAKARCASEPEDGQ